jgi:type I restriction enzyme S subunit
VTQSTARLGDLAEFVNGLAFKPEDWEESGAKIIRIQNLTDPDKAYNHTTRDVADKFLVAPGDLLVSWSASLGVFEWPGPDTAVLNQHIFRVVPNERRVCKAYLRYALIYALIQMKRHLHGATMQHVNRGEFLDTRVPAPPLPEQRRIAAILDQANELRQKRTLALDRLRNLPSAIFVECFGAGERSGTVTRREALGSHLSFMTSGGRNWSQYYSDQGSRFLRSFDVQMNEIGNEEVVYVTPPDNAEARRTRVLSGDVLLTITGSRIGRVAPVPDMLAGSYISQHVAILRPNPSLHPRFLSFYLGLSDGGQRQIAKAQYGQTKPGLNFEQIRAFLVPAPDMDMQMKFVSTVDGVDAVVTTQKAHLSKLEALFASLQNRAFTGKLTARQAERELELAG